MNITIIGTGYVGLVTGACFAETGNNVTCLDIDSERVDLLSKGEVPFFEPGLTEMVKRHLESGRIKFTTSYADGCKNNVFFICVGTPDDGEGKPDLKGLESVLKSLNGNLNENSFVFTKSTVPLGTNARVRKYFEDNSKYEVQVSSNPEFLKEGAAINDFQRPDRIIVGTRHIESKEIMEELYEPFSRVKNKINHVSVESAELIKYASNSFLATKISFMNEMALVCEKTGADINEVRLGMGSDPRIGSAFLYAGLGYGGSCFPKDVNALMGMQEELGLSPKILKKTKEVNDNQLVYFRDKIKSYYGDNSINKNLTIWGLSFKPNSDDIRESVSIKLIKELSNEFYSLSLYDPVAMGNAKKELMDFRNIKFFNDKYQSLLNSNGLIICTEWKEFWDPDLSKFDIMKERVVFDGRNIINKKRLEDSNIRYFGVGV